MSNDTKVFDHLSNINEIIFELEAIGFKVEEEDIVLRLMWSLLFSYDLIKPILMYDKETLSYDEIANMIVSEKGGLIVNKAWQETQL